MPPANDQRVVVVNAEDNKPLPTTEKPFSSVAAFSLTIGITPTPIRAGASNLSGRRRIMFQPAVSGYVWGFSAALLPFDLSANAPTVIDVGPEVTIYVKKNTGTNTVNGAELA